MAERCVTTVSFSGSCCTNWRRGVGLSSGSSFAAAWSDHAPLLPKWTDMHDHQVVPPTVHMVHIHRGGSICSSSSSSVCRRRREEGEQVLPHCLDVVHDYARPLVGGTPQRRRPTSCLRNLGAMRWTDWPSIVVPSLPMWFVIVFRGCDNYVRRLRPVGVGALQI